LLGRGYYLQTGQELSLHLHLTQHK
jgi:hypothetical protein